MYVCVCCLKVTYKQRIPQSHTIQPWHQIDCTKLRSWRKELQWKELILGLYSCLDLLIQSGLVSGEHEGWGRPRAVRGGGGWIRLRHVIVEPAITLSLVQGLSERSVSTNFVSTSMHYTRRYFMDQKGYHSSLDFNYFKPCLDLIKLKL